MDHGSLHFDHEDLPRYFMVTVLLFNFFLHNLYIIDIFKIRLISHLSFSNSILSIQSCQLIKPNLEEKFD